MKKHFIRNLCLLLATVLLVSCFAACKSDKKEKKEDDTDIFVTPKPSPEELGGIVTLSTYRTAPNDTSAFMFIQEYVLQYPGVEVYNDNEYTYDEYFATLDERVENGTIGDVFLVDSDRLAKYVEKGTWSTFLLTAGTWLNSRRATSKSSTRIPTSSARHMRTLFMRTACT